MLEIPFPVGDFNVSNVRRIKRNIRIATDLANDGMMDDGNVWNDTPIAKRDSHDLVVHAGLRLAEQELAPVFGQRRHHI